MLIFRHLEEFPADFGKTVLSAGNFDGVHRAHQHVLKEMMQTAQDLRAKSVVVTFEPHPVRILRPDAAPKLITPLENKLELLSQTGIDAALVIPFTRDFSMTSPLEFARLLKTKLGAVEVHEGANFHFGHKAEGNVTRLQEMGRELGFEVKIYSEMRSHGEIISSSRIRELILQGKVSRARSLLGRPLAIAAPPGRGRGYGHKYTVPTINLAHYDELVPADGVYITRTRAAGECFDSVTNIGTRPTFGAESFAIETHLLNFHPIELSPGSPVEICFLQRLRPEIKFPSVEALREQIARDVHRARRYLRLARRLEDAATIAR